MTNGNPAESEKFNSSSNMTCEKRDNPHMVDVARWQKWRQVKACLAQNAHPDSRDEKGNTVLHIACYFNSLRIAEIFLTAGANPNLANNDGDFAIHISAVANKPEMIAALSLHGAGMNVRNNNDESPLFLAARHNNINACKALIAHGAHYDPELDKKAWDIIQKFNPYALAEFDSVRKHTCTEPKFERRQQDRRMKNVELNSEAPELSS